MTVVPIAELGHRMPEAGRIRLGIKAEGARYPQKLKTMRFTSAHKDSIDEIAALYGGEVKPWSPSKGRDEFEVITTVDSVPVVMPGSGGFDPLQGTPIYETWSGGGIVRRCNGTLVDVSQRTPTGAERVSIPCLCATENTMMCKPTTRLHVVLAEINFAGTWRLETHSWFAARELPGMVAAIQALQASGFAKATLAIDPRTDIKDGKTRHYLVPVLRTEHTPAEIAAGQSHLQGMALTSPRVDPSQLALPSVPPSMASDPDDEIVEAEIVGEGEGLTESSGEAPTSLGDEPPSSPTFRGPHVPIAIKIRELGLTDDDRHAFAFSVSDGRTSSSKDLTPEECQRVIAALARIEGGEVEYTGVVEGRAVLHRKEPPDG